MELKNPDAPATKKQTFLIFRLSGNDVRDNSLTMKQAADQISALLNVHRPK